MSQIDRQEQMERERDEARREAERLMSESWQIEWATYYGPVHVVRDDMSVVLGEAVDHHTESDNPCIAIRVDGCIEWHHPRYVAPVGEPYCYAGGCDV